MPEALGLLEQRVTVAVDLIASLRDRIARLEQELEALHAESAAEPSCEPALLEELTRLRTERRVVRERIHELVKEIDRVSW